jgi:exopolysaccharide biosynthesis polyprenyl glycosylphosphotransferase
LAHDAPLQERLGRQARARYEEQHQPGQAAAAMQEVYEEVPLVPNSVWPFASWHRRSELGSGVERTLSSWTHVAWTATGTLLFVLAWYISQWLESSQVVTFVFSQTVLACLIPYAVACHLLVAGTRLPSAEQTGLVLVTTGVPFALMPLFFGLVQAPYSRGALLLCLALTVLWFALTWKWLQPLRAPKLVFWHHEQAQALDKVLKDVGIDLPAVMNGPQALKLIRWPDHWRKAPERVPRQLAVRAALHGVSAANLSRTDQEMLSTLKLRSIRLYSPQAVAEALSGRMPGSLLASESWQPEGDQTYDLVKRALDATLVLLTLPLWLPMTLLVAVAVRVDSPGPVLFSQWRAGRDGRPFLLHKFRSMRHEDLAPTAQFAQRDDQRVTRWGRIMRRTRIDELPQLWNVLVGDMSLIGPRPEQLAFVDQFAHEIPSYPYRHLVRPGLTGWAQVHQGYAAGPEETAVKLSYDLYYVVHYSLAMDLLILAKTVGTVVSGRGSR